MTLQIVDPENVTQLLYYYEYEEIEVENVGEKENNDCDTTLLKTITLVLFCVTFVVGTVGNGLVVYVTGFRMKKTVNSVWFLNLALADFLFTAFLIVAIVHASKERENGWILGDFLCKCTSLVNVLNMFASIFILTGMSLDRCLSAWLVVWAQNKRTPRKAEFTCVGIWLASLACSLPFSVFRKVEEFNGRNECHFALPPESYRHLVVFRFVVGFFIPALVIVGSNVAIAMRARTFQRRSRRSVRIIVTIILAFFICWLPFHIFQFLAYRKLVTDCVAQFGLNLSSGLGIFNSCMNPILYVFMCGEFRKKLRQSVCLVFESALAEDHSFASSRSLASQLSRISRKSDCQSPKERSASLTTGSEG